MVTIKFWKWRIRKKKIEESSKPEDTEVYEIYPSKNCVLTTTEVELELKPCKVHSDHFISYRDKKVHKENKRKPRIMMKPHILTIPLWEILPGLPLKIWLAKLLLPRFLRFRVYTVRREGELTHDIDMHRDKEKHETHDPNTDNYKIEDKMKLEAMLKLEGKFAEANAGAEIYEGMKGKPKWFEYIPYIVIAVICFLFLFSFQIAPNM